MRFLGTMAIKESYLGVLLFLVVLPALLLFTPGTITFVIAAIITISYLALYWHKPQRRCVPCGEVVTLGPNQFILSLRGKLDCPKCGSQIKNKHKV